MAAVVLLSELAPATSGADFAALEAAAHGRARDASRGDERWLGVAMTVRTVRRSPLAAFARDAFLPLVVAERAVAAGLADQVVHGAADVVAAVQAAQRVGPRVVVVATPCEAYAVRTAGPRLAGVERVLVVGVPALDGAPRAAEHACPGCGDAVNALADVVLGAFDDGAPWAVVRNRAGRALLDALEAEVVCEAVDAPGASRRLAAVRARVEAPAPRRGARPEVMP